MRIGRLCPKLFWDTLFPLLYVLTQKCSKKCPRGREGFKCLILAYYLHLTGDRRDCVLDLLQKRGQQYGAVYCGMIIIQAEDKFSLWVGTGQCQCQVGAETNIVSALTTDNWGVTGISTGSHAPPHTPSYWRKYFSQQLWVSVSASPAFLTTLLS